MRENSILTIQQELDYLYVRRLALDDLIRSLERYQQTNIREEVAAIPHSA